MMLYRKMDAKEHESKQDQQFALQDISNLKASRGEFYNYPSIKFLAK